MNIQNEFCKLRENKLMKTNEEIQYYEEALENIFNEQDYRHISNLFIGFDDNTEHEEVMYGLVHAIEAYHKIVNLEQSYNEILKGMISSESYAKEWIKILNGRILGNEQHLNQYNKIVSEASTDIKLFIIEIMNEIKQQVDDVIISNKINNFILNLK